MYRAMRRVCSAPLRGLTAAVLAVALAVAAGCGSSGSSEPACGPSGRSGVGSWGIRSGNPAMVALHGMATVWTPQGWFLYGGYGGGWQNPTCQEAPYSCRGGALYDPAADSWEVLDVAPFEEQFGGEVGTFGRDDASAVWDGADRVIVWGGEQRTGDEEPYLKAYQDGGIFHLSTRTWEYLPAPGGILGRGSHHLALWIGDGLFIWGGRGDDSVDLAPSGGVLRLEDPPRWEPTSGEARHVANITRAVWTGEEVLLWGGSQGNGPVTDTGAAYRPETRSWRPLSMEGAPSSRGGHSAVWTGSEMIVFGGVHERALNDFERQRDGAAYNPRTDSWRPISLKGAPSARASHVAVWTGTQMLIWGGQEGCPAGALYDPEKDEWTPMSADGAPPGVWNPFHAWTGEQLLVRGGGINHLYSFRGIGVFTP